MMQVISFKVEDDIYFALKSQNKTFRSIFEPLAIQQLKVLKMKYTAVNSQDLGDLNKDIQAVKNICDKMLKSFKWDEQ